MKNQFKLLNITLLASLLIASISNVYADNNPPGYVTHTKSHTTSSSSTTGSHSSAGGCTATQNGGACGKSSQFNLDQQTSSTTTSVSVTTPTTAGVTNAAATAVQSMATQYAHKDQPIEVNNNNTTSSSKNNANASNNCMLHADGSVTCGNTLARPATVANNK